MGKMSMQMKVRQSMGLRGRVDSTFVPNGLIKCFNLSRGAKQLWCELFSYSYNGGDIFPGIDRMARNLGVCKMTIIRDTKELIKIGLVEVEHQGFNKTNLYTLYDPDELGLPNGSHTYINAHPEEFNEDGEWIGVQDEVTFDEVTHMLPSEVTHMLPGEVTHMLPEEDEVNKTKNKKTKHMSSSKSSISESTKKTVEYLNEKADKQFTASKTTNKLITALLNDGMLIEDFKVVIDFKVSKWLKDDKMDEFLRPKTLFAEKNFQDYLSEAKDWASKGRPTSKVNRTGYKGAKSNDDYSSVVQ